MSWRDNGAVGREFLVDRGALHVVRIERLGGAIRLYAGKEYKQRLPELDRSMPKGNAPAALRSPGHGHRPPGDERLPQARVQRDAAARPVLGDVITQLDASGKVAAPPLPAGFIEPCLPTASRIPPAGPDWLHEIKHDGYRLMARPGRPQDAPVLCAVTHTTWSERFPRIREALASLRARSATIDGEFVGAVQRLASRFSIGCIPAGSTDRRDRVERPHRSRRRDRSRERKKRKGVALTGLNRGRGSADDSARITKIGFPVVHGSVLSDHFLLTQRGRACGGAGVVRSFSIDARKMAE